MQINEKGVPVSPSTVMELSQIVRAMNESSRSEHVTAPADLPLAETPTDEEVRALMDAL